MIYIRIKQHTTIESGSPVRLQDVAWFLADARLELANVPVPLPRDTGIWLVDAGAVLSVVHKHCPKESITILGDPIGWLKRLPGRGLLERIKEGIRSMAADLFTLACETQQTPTQRHQIPSFSLRAQPRPADRETRVRAAPATWLTRNDRP